MSLGDDFVFTLLTADPCVSQAADLAGVNRIGPDLEQVGKAARQGHLKTWISNHQMTDVAKVGAVLRQAKLFVRTNPVYPGLAAEIETLLEMKAQVLMLPMLTTVEEAEQFVKWVNGRAKVVLLIETPAATVRLPDILRVKGIDEIHFGLNDLSLGMGLRHPFEILVSEWLGHLVKIVEQAGLPWGIGGLGKPGDTTLPIPPDLVLAQCVHLKATRALIARSFWQNQAAFDWSKELILLRQALTNWSHQDENQFAKAQQQLKAYFTPGYSPSKGSMV